MRKSTETELQEVRRLVLSVRRKVEEFLQLGKRVHFIWDFDGVLTDSRSDDVFSLLGFDLGAYFAHEERLFVSVPEQGPWLLPIAHNAGAHPHFSEERFSQDIVTARSSTLAIRVHMFCLAWHLPVRWILFLGHQPKKESYRIILESLKEDSDYRIFCVDDNPKHVAMFESVSAEEGMQDRTFGIVSPVIRTYTEAELIEYVARVKGAAGGVPIRVRDPGDDMRGFLVLPDGLLQFRKEMNAFLSAKQGEGHTAELRHAFVQAYGEVGQGRFKSEEELQQAMADFILSYWEGA